MFLDALLTLSDAQALSATAVSTNTIDLGNITGGRDIGIGEPMTASVAIDVALAGTTPTLLIEFIQSANADLSSPDVLGSSGTLSGAAAVPVGQIFEIDVPAGRITKRYIGLRYTLGGTTPTVTVTACIIPSSMSSQAKPRVYPKNYNI